jgi:hypothetical protein
MLLAFLKFRYFTVYTPKRRGKRQAGKYKALVRSSGAETKQGTFTQSL